MSDKLKIVLVDDQNLCRRGLSELLANCYGFSVLGATGSIDELRVLLDQKPDLLIIDLRMKPMDGITLLTQLRKEGYTTPAVMLTMSDSETDLTNAIRAGVRGYLLKDMAPEDVVDAIRRVAAGELVVAPTMTVKMIDMLRGEQPEEFTQTAHRARARDPAIAGARRKQQVHRIDPVHQLRYGKAACAPHPDQAQPVFPGQGSGAVRHRAKPAGQGQ
jgi:DNA-binding NarL/FixJ family response regulator